MGILEIDARNILINYTGFNNQILLWQFKYKNTKNFKLVRTQCDYIIKYHEVVPKVAKKHINLVISFGEKLMDEKLLVKPIEKIWCEKLLCETDKAYHIWGKMLESECLYAFWLPKMAVLIPSKKFTGVIDYSKYDVRPPMLHQKIAVETLLSNNKFILADDMGVGKFLPNNTLIYTPYGTTNIGSLNVGDKIIGSNGKSCTVIGVFPQGKKETYKITFNDGYSILAGDEHLWTVRSCNSGENSKNRENRDITISTKQMLDKNLKMFQNGTGWNKKRNYEYSTYYKLKNGNSKWQIPIVKPIEFENNYELPIDPYLLGLGLGNGSFTKNGVVFSLHKDDYDELFNNFNLTEHKSDGNKRKGYINTGNCLIDLNLFDKRSHNKFIPEIYKYSSIENRLSILQGLMDTDGHCMKSKNGTFHGTEYSTISEKLCDDVAEIVQTLGGICRKKSRKSYYKKNGVRIECNISYRLNIKLPIGMNPFRLKRKHDSYNTPKKYSVGRYIKNIETVSLHESTCISVDSPDKLYVAEHCIVTHNTTSATIASLESGAKKILIVCPSSLKINWKRELEIYTDRRILILEGSKWGSTFDYYIINYDILKNYHNLEDKENSLFYKEKFDLAIIDEAHFISNTNAIRTQIVNDLLETIPKVWLLTGTPITSRPINYFNLLKIVDSPLTLNWQHYVKRYCGGFQFKKNGIKIWSTGGATNLDELRERSKNLVLRRLKHEILDLPDKIITPVYLELGNMKFYNDELESFIKITDEEKQNDTITVSLNRLMKLRQMISFEKIDYTCELIDKFLELNKKVIVFTNFTMTLDTIHEKYPKNSVVLDGRMNKDKRQQSIDKFQNDDKIKIFIGNIIAAGAGITLTAAEGVIMNDLSFVPAHHAQAEDRCVFGGQLILTKNGYKKIENINIGDYVYTHLGNFKEVINTSNHLERKKYKVDIKSFGSYCNLSVTNDHKLYVYDKICDNFYWIESEKLNILNHCLTLKINKQPIKEKSVLNVKNYVNETFNNNFGVLQKNGRLYELPNEIELTDDLLYAFGFYIAEGWSYIGDENKSSSVNVCQKITNKKMYDASEYIIKIISKSFGFDKYSEYIDKSDTKTCTIYSKNLAMNFIEWFGKGCENKKLPEWVDELNNEQLTKLLDGYYHGDGYLRKNTQSANTVSPLLGSQLVRYCTNLNYGVVFNTIKPKTKNHKTQYKIEYTTTKNTKNRIINKNGYIIYPITSLTMKRPKHNGEERVYDLSVKDDNSFVVGTYNVHNCFRIGQKNNVLVYYPIFENTIEMNVYNILQRKKNIIDQVMGDGEYSESFSKELLSNIFKKPLD